MRAVLVTITASSLLSSAALAQDTDYRGLWVSTPYPSIEVAPGDDISFSLTVHNANRPPQRVALSVLDAPEDWDVRLLGGGKPVGAVFVGPDATANLQLELEPPAGTAKGEYSLTVRAAGSSDRFDLPLEVVIGETPPAKLELDPELPILPGTPDTAFRFNVELENGTGEDALIALSADAPPGFQVSFKERFGSQRLSSVAVEAGRTQGLEIEVRPPQGTEAGRYPVTVRAMAGEVAATTELMLDVSGQPALRLTAPGELLSGRVEAGEQTPLQLVLQNTGSAPAQGVRFSASQPQGWEIEFEPETVPVLPPGERVEVRALVTAPAEAIAGDYMLTLRANADAASANSEFRVTVRTSTLWGIVGLVVIAAAVAVLALAVMRYGRR
ncbi:MAG TPA: NEW3 domain-containing protein [Gammaproteobacteria bacterium]